MSNKEKRKDLVQQIEGLGIFYFDCWNIVDGQEVIDILEEYFTLLEADEMVDKRVICAIFSIMNTYERNVHNISDTSIQVSASKMYKFILETIMQWRPDFVQDILENGYDEDSPYEAIKKREE